MNENQNNLKYYKDELDLKEFTMALWKRKKMIISITLIVALLAFSFSKFIVSPVYNTNLNIVINMPEVYNTKYGEYTLPITTNEQYINLIKSNNVLINTAKDMGYNSEEFSIESMKKRISIGGGAETINSFEITVSSDNPKESLELAKVLFENYIEFIDVMTEERAVHFYNNYFNIQLEALESNLTTAKEMLKKNEELLSQTTKIMNDGNVNLEIQTKLNSTSDYVVPVVSVNPNYIKIETDIVENKQLINSIENSKVLYSEYLNELNIEKEAINKYYEIGQTEKLESSIIGVAETSIYLPSPPVAPIYKTSPNNVLNTLIGGAIGGMISVIVILVKEYWFKEN